MVGSTWPPIRLHWGWWVWKSAKSDYVIIEQSLTISDQSNPSLSCGGNDHIQKKDWGDSDGCKLYGEGDQFPWNPPYVVSWGLSKIFGFLRDQTGSNEYGGLRDTLFTWRIFIMKKAKYVSLRNKYKTLMIPSYDYTI